MLPEALKNFHDGVYVITVESFKDRQANAVKELGRDNFAFVYSVDRSLVTKQQMIDDGLYDEQRAIETDRSSKPMTLGHICCSLGHANVYRHIIKNGIERALIFEDDVTILPNDEVAINVAVENIPADAELIYWGWTGVARRPRFAAAKQALYKLQHSMGLLKYDHTMVANLYPTAYNEYFSIAGKQFCAHAYTLTRSAAEKLLEWNTPVILNADNALMYAVLNGDVKAYISNRQFFGQRSLDENDPISSLTQS
ncbi:MAG: glycosyltransferase family 25 protein [Acidobacteriota bacterium]